jgi:hypothetical protein
MNVQTVIMHPVNVEQISALEAFASALKIKFEITKEESYSPEFIAKVEESKRQYKNGEFISIEKKDIKKFLGLQ